LLIGIRILLQIAYRLRAGGRLARKMLQDLEAVIRHFSEGTRPWSRDWFLGSMVVSPGGPLLAMPLSSASMTFVRSIEPALRTPAAHRLKPT
jgi:hypothetical protein